jgi:DNA modification methylase
MRKDSTIDGVPVFCAFDDLAPIESITPNPRNPNTHPDSQVALLAKIISAQGWRAPITVSNRSGFVTKGHGRLLAARHMGQTSAPVDRQDYADEASEYADMIADNRIAELAEIDATLLKDLILDIDTGDIDIELTGFTEAELARMMSAVGQDDIVEDEAPEPPADPVTKPGDLWLLGEHRVLCGDSTKAEDVARLMDGRKADCVFTDPPYGVGYTGGAKKRKALENDHVGTSIYGDALPNLKAAAADHAALYLWYADAHAAAAAAAAAGYDIVAQIIWVKNNAQFVSAAKYHGKHEPCFYAHRHGKSARWVGGNNEVTVWECDRANKNEFHPTQKPVALGARALGNSTNKGDTVLDLFGGSGSTLIAAEQTGRTCYTMELDPAYCDVIVQRWENLTGRKAVLDNGTTDETHA